MEIVRYAIRVLLAIIIAPGALIAFPIFEFAFGDGLWKGFQETFEFLGAFVCGDIG